ncbi:hypothetical protein G9272_01890 [Streptomyces asoensis]|uniref:NADP-dependent oxidoreductase domain-containing protein n=1 Tax=Streptomyces asoensis TaxID=249586 RepID=A0A6M4WGC5_9ACTN|nr:hypothetical protein G9272_01890 [Streptomyces asoensis]
MSLRRFRVERIDLSQLHRIDPDTPFEDQIGELKKLRDESRIRHIRSARSPSRRPEQRRRSRRSSSRDSRSGSRAQEGSADHGPGHGWAAFAGGF